MNAIPCSLILLVCALGLAEPALAHPVAQGALEVEVLPGRIHVQARVSGEEVFVANALAAKDEPKAVSLAEVWERHGRYLLRHLRVFADGQALPGRVLKVDAAQTDFIVYQLEFPGPQAPAHCRIEEDVLNEIDYAPGNPWEAAYAVRVQQGGSAAREGLLLSRRQPLALDCDWKNITAGPAAPLVDTGRTIEQYLRHGVAHILSGYDHLLFVIALVLATATVLDLVKVVTAFTLAHTVTLSLSVLQIVRLPANVIEPMIAGSIVFVAVTNTFWPESSRGWLRVATAFFFGLFHGLGFAGGLLNATNGMAGLAIFLAIGAFSLGVELGHQMVVLPLFAGLKLARATQADETARERLTLLTMRVGSVLISVAGTIYLVAALRLR
jgi:hydrogenase/urease accessory protein HupE